ncbi:MAG TPA: MarR family transcriptional regulator [Burkholderiales bacterium]|nr:MarR family transcriptional regulator [Burkholderiales bacterium]
MEPESISQTDYETLATFRQTLREFLHFSEQAAKKLDLTPQQHQALLAIKGHKREGINVGDLANILKIQPHSAVGLVNRLVANKLAIRQAAEQDRRQVFLTLSSKGEKMLEKLSVAHRHELRRLKPALIHLLNLLDSDFTHKPQAR